MDKETFIRILSAFLTKRLGKQVKETTFRKLGVTYTGLRTPDKVSVILNVDDAFEKFQDGYPLPLISAEAEKLFRMPPIMEPSDLKFIESFDNAKPHLFIRLSNHERNAEYLNDVPHVDVMDLSLTFHLLIDADCSSCSQMVVTNELMNAWCVDLETLRHEAMISSERLFPAELIPMSDILGVNLTEAAETMVLTNSAKLNGASALFYKSTVEKLNEQFKEGCYLIPSSIHEFLVVDRKAADVSTLIELLHTTNRDSRLVNEEAILSDSLYCVDRSGLHRYADA